MLEQHFLQKPTSWHAGAVYTLVFFLCFCQSCQTITADPKEIKSHTWKEAFQFLGFNWTLTREIGGPYLNATPHRENPDQIALSKDVPLNVPGSNFKSFIRLYIPTEIPRETKLPVIIFIHGGGFVQYRASSAIYHYHLNNMTARVPAVIASVEYRLAPENPLPASYEDALHAVLWLKSQAQCCHHRDPWLDQYADFSKVFILGESAGGNIAYHAALRATTHNLQPMRIQGVILAQAFFGGVKRTSSEIRLIEDAHLPLYVNDAYWTLSLPFQANRDHKFSNPFIHGFDRVKRVPKWFVKDDEGDPLIDRSKEFVRLLELYEVPVFYRFYPGGYHDVEVLDFEAALVFFHDVKTFIYYTGVAED